MRRPAVLRVDPWWALRRRLRTPVVHWALAAALGIVTVAVVDDQYQRARAEAERYGRATTVAVAAADLPAGRVVSADDVRLERLPAAMVPADALREPPVGRRLTTPVRAREVLVGLRLRGGSSALAARVPDGFRAVAVPVAEPGLELRAGDLVDLVAPDVEVGAHDVVVADAEVLSRTEGVVTVVVPGDDLGPVADALAAGTVQLALSGR